MGSASFPTDESQKGSNFEEIFMQHSLHFADSLKDLKNLREQLYSAAEHFESSFDKEDHKQFLVEKSKDYVAKALVNTVDHLGSVADKLNKFLDQKADEFSDINIRFSCIQQKLNTFQGFIEFRGIPRQLTMVEARPKHHKKYIIRGEENFQFGKISELLYRNCISYCPQYDDMHQIKQDNTFAGAFQVAAVKLHPKSSRKGKSKFVSSANSPQLTDFSFTRVVPKKETVKRSVSPLLFPIMRSGSVANRSASPSPSGNNERDPSEPRRRAISVSRRPESMNTKSYAKKSKHIFKAILTINRPIRDL